MKRYLGAVVLVSVAMCWPSFAKAASLSILPDPLVGSPGDTVLTSVEYTAQGAQVAAMATMQSPFRVRRFSVVSSSVVGWVADMAGWPSARKVKAGGLDS